MTQKTKKTQPPAAMPDFMSFGMDNMTAPLGLFVAMQKRNAEAMVEVFQCSLRSVQGALSQQNNMTARLAQDNSRFARDLMQEHGQDERMEIHSNMVQHVYNVSMENSRQVRELFQKAEVEMCDIVTRRMEQSWGDFNTIIKLNTAPIKKKAKISNENTASQE